MREINPELKINDMTTTIKNLLIAQNYSDAAKDINSIDCNDLHGNKIIKIWRQDLSFDDTITRLYSLKSDYLVKAMKSAKREKIEVFYDDYEGCLYFEMPFGQCSFHYFDEVEENVNIVEDYKWSGLKNTGDLLRANY